MCTPFTREIIRVQQEPNRFFRGHGGPVVMKRLARWTEVKVSLITVIFLFWALFWVLNGGDKFFNGQYVPNLENWSSKGVLVDSNGDVTHTRHSMETVGPFGVNRDAQMVGFFQRIHLPGEMALVSLSVIAVLELLLPEWCFHPIFSNF